MPHMRDYIRRNKWFVFNVIFILKSAWSFCRLNHIYGAFKHVLLVGKPNALCTLKSKCPSQTGNMISGFNNISLSVVNYNGCKFTPFVLNLTAGWCSFSSVLDMSSSLRHRSIQTSTKCLPYKTSCTYSRENCSDTSLGTKQKSTKTFPNV